MASLTMSSGSLIQTPALRRPAPFSRSTACRVICSAKSKSDAEPIRRREVLLNGVNVGVLASLFTFGAVERPSTLGLQNYGDGVKQLGLCPKSPNCISTAEAINDLGHFVPPWTYNPEEGRGSKNPISKAQAIDELVETVSNMKPDNFEPTLIKRTDDFVYFEFQSPTFGFIDDVEFYFPDDRTGEPSRVEYRSASRIGESDGDINRKRIRAIRKELEKKGWKSVGF